MHIRLWTPNLRLCLKEGIPSEWFYFEMDQTTVIINYNQLKQQIQFLSLMLQSPKNVKVQIFHSSFCWTARQSHTPQYENRWTERQNNHQIRKKNITSCQVIPESHILLTLLCICPSVCHSLLRNRLDLLLLFSYLSGILWIFS